MFDQESEIYSNMNEEQRQEKNKEMVANLHKIIAPFMMRRIKKNALRFLPPKKIIHLYTGLTEI